MTYADLAPALGMSESSVKRVFAKADMPLSRIDEILRVLKMDFAELARKVVDAQPLARELTEQQEAAVVADRRLLLLAICCLSQWSFEEMTQEYAFSDAECIKYLARLDHLGIIELRPLNRYRLKVSKGFRWLPHGPVMRYFREHVAADYLSGGFDGDGELIMLVHGQITQEPGRDAGRAAAARRPGLRPRPCRRAQAAGRAARFVHAAGRHADLAVRRLPRPEADAAAARLRGRASPSPSARPRAARASGVEPIQGEVRAVVLPEHVDQPGQHEPGAGRPAHAAG